jgi:ParB/RepB/Spo0J family partition protein
MSPETRPSGFKFGLVAGHRRYTSVTRYLKWTSIAASVRSGLTERQARMLNFTENLERKDLNMLEEARWIGTYFPAGTSINAMSNELKRDARWIASRVRLMKLPELIQQMAASQTLSAVDIDTIAAQETIELQLKAAQDIQLAKRRGEGREAGRKYGRKFRYRMSKSQISEMVKYMLERGVDGLAPRALTWAAGYIGNDDLIDDIEKELRSKIAETVK